MEFKITKEFIIEAHGAACSDWKKRIEREFHEAFPSLEIGRWYKQDHFQFNYQGGKTLNYGFINGYWYTRIGNANNDQAVPMTHEEIESALIAEAKKRGYKKGARVIGLYPSGKPHAQTEFIINDSDFVYGANEQTLLCNNGMYRLFINGIWAEILPQEKTVVPMEKALKILAKKLKVSPENIEIE